MEGGREEEREEEGGRTGERGVWRRVVKEEVFDDDTQLASPKPQMPYKAITVFSHSNSWTPTPEPSLSVYLQTQIPTTTLGHHY